ncbi:MAG: PrsW family glutamic-type intramembrane protease, partial [Candidatus Staskawiczbacteria bacterium]
SDLVYWFLIIALSEELFKFIVIKIKVINSPNLDEPLDIMLYMVIAALGFAAIENILYLFAPAEQLSFNGLLDRTIVISIIRFVGATFLHTLCSATVGYSLAISFCEAKRKYLIFAAGVIMAVLLHGLYDFSIMTLNGYLKLGVPVIIILVLAFLVFSGFEKLKQMKGICKIK